MSLIELQRLREADQATAVELIVAAFGNEVRVEFESDWQTLMRLELQGAAWGAWADGRLVGFLAWTEAAAIGKDLFTLQWGCVHPDWRHRRILHQLAVQVLRDMETSIDRDGLILTKTWPVKPVLKLGFTPVPGYGAESGKVLLTKPISVDRVGWMLRRQRACDLFVVPRGTKGLGVLAKGYSFQ